MLLMPKSCSVINVSDRNLTLSDSIYKLGEVSFGHQSTLAQHQFNGFT